MRLSLERGRHRGDLRSKVTGAALRGGLVGQGPQPLQETAPGPCRPAPALFRDGRTCLLCKRTRRDTFSAALVLVLTQGSSYFSKTCVLYALVKNGLIQ